MHVWYQNGSSIAGVGIAPEDLDLEEGHEFSDAEQDNSLEEVSDNHLQLVTFIFIFWWQFLILFLTLYNFFSTGRRCRHVLAAQERVTNCCKWRWFSHPHELPLLVTFAEDPLELDVIWWKMTLRNSQYLRESKFKTKTKEI